ncbi:MAG: SMC family ATPase [Anaerolineae bacterium]|nr:SMC family ATPase [Anaerolineae bacterium]
MRIVQIDLENVKSYCQASVSFVPGTNAICGPNGAGKSTLLEAVGFVLFDFLLMTQAQFVREGEKVASVVVHLADQDGRIYQVVRKCGSYHQYYVYDPEIEQKLADGKGEVLAWLYQFMDVEESVDLAALFRDAVGVPQGLLTAVFLDKASNRKNTFNPLLRVDEYERAWQALREPRRALEIEIGVQERRIAALEAEARALPGWQQKVASLEAQIEADEGRQIQLQDELAVVVQRKTALDAAREHMEELRQAVLQAEASVAALAAQRSAALAAAERARAAQAVVAETTAAYQAYELAHSELEQLEQQREERDRLATALRDREAELALVRQRIERLEADMAAVAAAEAELEALHPRVKEQERLEEALADTRRAAERLFRVEQELADAQSFLVDEEQRLLEAQEGLAERQQIEHERESLRQELAALDEQRDKLALRAAALRAEGEQLAARIAALEQAEGARCPLCEGPLTAAHRAEILERDRLRQETAQAALAEVEAAQERAEVERAQRRETLRSLEERLVTLPRPAEVEGLEGRVEMQRAAALQAEGAVTELREAPADVERLAAQVDALGDPRRAVQRASDVAARRAPLQEQLVAAGEGSAVLTGQIADLAGCLAAYAGLDERHREVRALLDRHEAAHRRYLSHFREAEVLSERQSQVAALTQELEALQDDLLTLSAERDEAAAAYDAPAYARLVTAYDDLRGEAAALEERVRQQQAQLAAALAEVTRLLAVHVELEEARGARQELEQLLSLLEVVRRVLRDAGPLVTRALVAAISLQAARLYTDIMGDYAARLRWSEDYEIILTAGGRERTFQQLSGGEQMAAALAVRLALLREVSSIDLAFFDEPTANLDDYRRDNLAEQIMNVRGLSQLFVISHDDTFERDTDHVVRVTKEKGSSRVVA